MIYLTLPIGSQHGWGVCGLYLTKELAQLTPVTLFPTAIDREALDPVDEHFINSCLAGPSEEFQARGPGVWRVPYPVLQAISGPEMLPSNVHLSGSPRVGYTFFEENILPVRVVFNAREHFDLVVAGSSWCEQVLREYGLTKTATVLQGVDPQIFNAANPDKSHWKDRFVVFSGGKFELRKGQDLVLRAYKALQDKHPDTLLVTSWFNFWDFSIGTMRASPYIRFNPSVSDFQGMMRQVIEDNGIDARRVVILPPQPNAIMARIYKNTDVGLFPNRCEGGTNLVLMEYMACGKPVIASWSSGHRDVLTPQTSIPIRNARQMTIQRDNAPVAVWDDPNLDETIHHLEWAYFHRDELRGIGDCAGNHMRRFTWAETARQFHSLLAAHDNVCAGFRAA